MYSYDWFYKSISNEDAKNIVKVPCGMMGHDILVDHPLEWLECQTK